MTRKLPGLDENVYLDVKGRERTSHGVFIETGNFNSLENSKGDDHISSEIIG